MNWKILLISFVLIIGYIIFKFLRDLKKDDAEFKNESFPSKFSTLVNSLNSYAYSGDGSITVIDTKEFNLYKDGSNQIIHFRYGAGVLTVVWFYKYLRQETKLEKDFSNARSVSPETQRKMAEIIIDEMKEVIEQHEIKVLNSL